jgi:hypothetical protein
MVGRLRENGELEYKLEIQKRALAASASAFDSGELWEAERLAVTAYTILHDGGTRTRSLLTQLGFKNKIRYVSSSRGFFMEHVLPSPTVHEVSPPTPLIIIELNEKGVEFKPAFSTVGCEEWHRWLSFSDWYEEPVFKNSKGRQLSRKNLIFSLRSQDGGAHVDPLLSDEAYADLRQDADPRISVSGKPIPEAHFATMRQIAWEIQESLLTAPLVQHHESP